MRLTKHEERRRSERYYLENADTVRKQFRRAALYVRVSTEDQDLEQQKAALERHARERGWKVVRVYEEKVSGVAKRRPALERMKQEAAMNQFDVLLFWSISRLGRDLLETLKLARLLYEERHVALVSHTQAAIDLSTPHGKLVLAVFGAIAEGQRDELVAATKRGMEAARRRGVKIGRPRKNLDAGQVAWIVKHNSSAFAARAFGVSRATIRRIMLQRPVPRQPRSGLTALHAAEMKAARPSRRVQNRASPATTQNP